MNPIHEPKKNLVRRRGEASGGPVAHEFNTCVRSLCDNEIYSSGLCRKHYDYTIADILENLPELQNRFPGIEWVI